ncbi:MAG: hypothetical protein JXA18_16110 [Chitinispirillaceae bacterium]|nr:hypothetical protein [Chitinispirillaceae bacterium]
MQTISLELHNIFMEGLVVDIFAAERCYSVLQGIGQRSKELNKLGRGFDELFGFLQGTLLDELILSITRLYEQPGQKYKVRSIPAAIEIINRQGSSWKLQQRPLLEKTLIELKVAPTPIRSMTDEELLSFIVNNYIKSLPEKSKNHICPLSKSLEMLKSQRDKVIAHPEKINHNVLPFPTFGEINELVNYAKRFVGVIGLGILGIAFHNSEKGYILTDDAIGMKYSVDRLVDAVLAESVRISVKPAPKSVNPAGRHFS